MAFLDFFIKADKKTKQKKNVEVSQDAYSYSANKLQTNSLGGNVKIFSPKTFDDVSEIIDMLAIGKPAIVNIKELKDTTAQRVLDLLSGAIYALRGGLSEVDKGIYLLSLSE